MNKEIKREIILDNYQNPVNRGLIDDKTYILKNTNSDSCIDNIDLMLKIVDNKIVDARFDGEACAICTSAVSIMIKKIIGKTTKDAEEIIINYQNMINEKEYNKELLGELNVYDEIYLQPNRKNCALLPSKAFINIIKIYEEK
ncbi:MAG: SUF system NifU family Fe-S cluster assembly protein [Mollicutes bacterium]|nr:SUF system NifU family Fe-S cluster assembly protein [Mollicutes bacterium]